MTTPALPTLPPEYLRPELMIIGDSLAQGCRSLSVQAVFCQQSWSARIGNAQGWRFRTPDFPRPILFDLEQEIRLLGDIIQLAPGEIRFQGLISRFMQNLRAWLTNKKESAYLCFDNLGLSGAQPYDLYTRTAASSNVEIAKICPNGPATSSVPFSDIGTLHLGIDAIDNYYLAGSLVPQLPFPPGKPPLEKVLNRGGFQSVDGMHPTGCGYAVVASWAMKVLNLPNNDLAKLLEQSFIDDSLLHDVPLKLDLLVAVLTEFRRAFRAGSAPVQPQEVMSEGVTDPHLINVVRLVHQIMKR